MYHSLRLIVRPLIINSAQIPYPRASYEEAEVPDGGCTYVCRFKDKISKNIIALTSQSLAAANNVLYCFNVPPAEPAEGIPYEQTLST
jgi:hypothetical protein